MADGVGSVRVDTADLPPPVRVVLAEDEAIIRLDLRETLEDEGYQVVGDTGRGDHAVDLVAELDPDVVILDIKMPGLDGIEAAPPDGSPLPTMPLWSSLPPLVSGT